MILTQVTIEITIKVKKPNGAEVEQPQLIALPAEQVRIVQSRLDEFSMQGLAKRYRYELRNVGEYENALFMFFYDVNGTKFKVETWERDNRTNKMILEGVVANGI